MTLHEALSRLLDGDLDPVAADALRTRIATEPDVARAWATMSGLPARIAGLSAFDSQSGAPPVGALPGRVLATSSSPQVSSARRPAFRYVPAVAVALAAGFALFVIVPKPTPQIVLGAGTSEVSGDVDVLVGDATIHVSGESSITVEPSPDHLRDARSEVQMDKSYLLAAFVGATLSLTVQAGTAVIQSPGKEPVTVTAGQTHREGPARPLTAAPGADPGADAAHIADLEQQLTGLKLQHAMEVAQLNSVNGTPQDFPADLPAGYKPAEFEKNIRDAIKGNPDVDVLSVNCDEYPCIAILRSSYAGDDWGQKLTDLGTSIRDKDYGENAGIHEDTELLRGPDGDVRVMAFATEPPVHQDENVEIRRSSRVKGLLDGIGDAEP